MTEVAILGKAVDLALLQELPLFGMPIQAGFPSPADDWQEGKIDLNQFLVKHPAADRPPKGDPIISREWDHITALGKAA